MRRSSARKGAPRIGMRLSQLFRGVCELFANMKAHCLEFGNGLPTGNLAVVSVLTVILSKSKKYQL